MKIFSDNIIRRLRNFRENVNIMLYDSKSRAMGVLDFLSIIAALVGVAALLFDHGFENTERNSAAIHFMFRSVIVFYYVKFFLGYLNSVFVNDLLKTVLDVDNPRMFSVVVEQVSFVILLIIEIGRASSFLPSMQMSAQKLFVLSFVVLILSGTGLLMLPKMTVEGVNLHFVDALFTATSASCVTGLSTVDIATYFTLRGQIIIMFLAQLGGLNIITFATFFLILSKKSIGIKNQALIKDSLDERNFSDSMRLLKEIFYSTFIIEGVGAVLIFFNWSNNTPFLDFYQKAYYSVFHSIMAFNNAGFSLFEGNLFNFYCRNAYVLQFVITALIFLGGIGFPVIKDVLGDFFFKKKGRINRKWALNTRIVVFTSLALIVIGTTFFMIFEWNNSLRDHPWGGKIIVSLFQAVTARTAGFQSVDFSILMNPTLILPMMLMFIGASPVSTGGGIKTTTFAVLVLSAINTIKGRERINVEHSQISNSAVLRAMTILLFSACFVIPGTIVLSFTDPDKEMIGLVFEQVSAFTTTGLSTGITPDLSTGSKVTLIVSMFMGRIGLLTSGSGQNQDNSRITSG